MPLLGTYRAGQEIQDVSLSFRQRAATSVVAGATTVGWMIAADQILGERFAFSRGGIYVMQRVVASTPGAITIGAGAAVIATGTALNESTRRRIGSRHYTTPFTSGFGSVV